MHCAHQQIGLTHRKVAHVYFFCYSFVFFFQLFMSGGKIRNMLQKTEWVDTIEGLRNLIDEAEKDGAK